MMMIMMIEGAFMFDVIVAATPICVARVTPSRAMPRAIMMYVSSTRARVQRAVMSFVYTRARCYESSRHTPDITDADARQAARTIAAQAGSALRLRRVRAVRRLFTPYMPYRCSVANAQRLPFAHVLP